MHESGLMRNLVRQLEDLARQHGCDRIAAVKLQIRDSGSYTAAHFREHLEAVSNATVIQDARVDIDLMPDDQHVGRPEITIVSIEVPA